MQLPCRLAKALKSTGRPVIVHVWDPEPAEVPSWAVADVSECCRTAGATAVLVAPDLVGAVAEEQEAHRGDFPGPLPVIADCALDGLAQKLDDLAAWQKLGASAVGVEEMSEDRIGRECVGERLDRRLAIARSCVPREAHAKPRSGSSGGRRSQLSAG